MIHLENVTKDNLFPVIKLSDSLDPDQKRAVAPNVVSIAQAYVNQDRAWLRAIYHDQELIGFIMVALFDEDIPANDCPAYFLWRFMIARSHQGQGYGKQVLDLLIKKCLEDGIKYLYVSCAMETPMPYRFYINYGFIDTNERDDDEEILKILVETKRSANTNMP